LKSSVLLMISGCPRALPRDFLPDLNEHRESLPPFYEQSEVPVPLPVLTMNPAVAVSSRASTEA
jgi:hypothetical protein